jgi:hypothetical protein
MLPEAAVFGVARGPVRPVPALAPGRRRLTSARVLAALALAAGLALLFPAGARSQAPTRVLFIGNSYTYFHNLPEMIVKLAAARRQKLEALMVAPGGWRLKDHWEKGEALADLRASRWDYVVLQEQSTLGVNYFVNGKARISTDEVFRPYAEKWAAEVRKAGATPVFYLTWARKASPEDQAALNSAYIRAAKAVDARVAPVGIAWAEVRQQNPSIELLLGDGSHPSAAGSYLAACTLLATLLNQSPVGLPETVSGVPVDLDTGRTEPGKIAVLADVRSEVAEALQEAAWHAWQETSRPAFFNVAPVTPPTVEPLPAGTALSPDRVTGTWKGSFPLYPSFRTDMVLRLDHDPGGWKGHLELRYNAKDAADQSFDLGDLQVTEREMTFTNPEGWQRLVMRFRAVKPRAGMLRGVVDATRPNADPPVRLVATWELRKR